MKNIIIWVGLILLSLVFYLYSNQMEMLIFLLCFIGLGGIIVKLFIRPNNPSVFTIYGIFIVIYGFLTILSHIELIHSPDDDYFIHTDAAWSFYHHTIEYVVPLKWSELIEGTVLNPGFIEYALAELLFGTVAKIAKDVGVINIRLALRILVFVMGALMNSMMIDVLLKNGISKSKCFKNVLIFGCFSYLFITSAIFSRDIFVCFTYVAIAYIILLPKCSFRFIKLVIFALCAFGGRPEHGAFAIVYILAYYMSLNRSKFIKVIALSSIFIVIFVILIYSSFISHAIVTIDSFEEETLSNTGGVFMKVYSLPFPINKICMVIYMLLLPLPPSKFLIGDGNTFLTLPFLLSPYLMTLIVIGCVWYIFKFLSKDKYVAYFMCTSLLGFCLIVSVSPDLRRAFATIPGLFLAYSLVSNKIPDRVQKNVKYLVWPIVLILSIYFQLYVSLR